ncbi:MAG: MurR/RpiR family transcriptional regulator [Limnochordia bacterium]
MSGGYRIKGSPLHRIHALIDQMSGVTYRIGRWFLQHDPTDVSFTTSQIAEELNTSRATVVRFCQRLGYEGFPEFKQAWVRQAITADAPDDAVQDIQLPGAARFVLTETWEAVKATPQTVDPVVFEKIVADMCAASLTVWCGLPGDAALIAQSGDHKMTRAALPSRWVSDIDGLQAVGRMVKPGDVLVVISHSGRWPWVAEEMAAFRERGCRVVIITSKVSSLMARAAEYVLLTPAWELQLQDKPMALRASQWMLVEMLVIETIKRTRSDQLTGVGDPAVDEGR